MKHTRTKTAWYPSILFGLLVLVVISGGTGLGIFLFRLYRPQPVVLETASPTLADILTNPTASLTPIPTREAVPPTPSLTPETGIISGSVEYIIQPGDTLSGIALKFGTTVEAIRQQNQLDGDTIYPGKVLIIPPLSTPTARPANFVQVGAADTVESIAAAHEVSPDDLRAGNHMYGDALLIDQYIEIPLSVSPSSGAYHFSILQGDLQSAYPLTVSAHGFTLHYSPGTFPAQDPQAVSRLVEQSVSSIENVLHIQLTGSFDVYVAGTLFEPPNRQLRGLTYSVNRQSFFLHDGTGDAVDQQYISVHELTHLFMWNTFGKPVSIMISEGAAVYSGMQAVGGSDVIPLSRFCAAYKQQGQLPDPAGSLAFQGHIYDLHNYYTSGCFAGYLIETYGLQAFGMVYSGGNFDAIYGKSLQALEQEWFASIDVAQIPVGFDPARLVGAVSTIEASYEAFMPNFSGTTAQLRAYRELDLARLAMLRGKFDEMDGHLSAYHQILNPP
jgi:LysM repeat protein